MPYEVVENFAAGLDNRKSPLTAPGGTLTRLVNATLTPGGEILKRRAFVDVGSVAGSFGLAATASTLYVFGRNVMPTLPSWPVPGVTLAGQVHTPNSATDFKQTDYDTFDGKIYMVGYQPSGVYPNDNPHYYNGVQTEGTGKGFFVRTYQSKIYSVLGQYLYFSAVGDPTLWDPPLQNAIPLTSVSSTNPTYVTFDPAETYKFRNGMTVEIAGADSAHTAANGRHQIYANENTVGYFYLVGTDTSLAGAAQGAGATVYPTAATGSGFINVSMQDSDSEYLTSLEVYYDKLAIFSTEAVQLWAVDPDPLQNAYVQLLRGTGNSAPLSPLQYGSGDVLYLDPSGVRSLKAKDLSNSAAVSDIGSPIDPLLQELYRTRGKQYMDSAISLLEPTQGRFWMIFPDRFLALSYFPGPKVTAWSEHTLPELGVGNTVTHAVACGGRIFLRSSNDRLYVYGGIDNTTFNNCGVEVRLPYLNGKKPGHNKFFEALDLTIGGTWEVRVSYDFNNPDAEEVVGTFSKSTWSGGRAELTGYGSHISLRFYNNDVNTATISNAAVHYQVVDDEQ